MTDVYLRVMGIGGWQSFAGPPEELLELPGGPELNMRPG